MHCGKCTSVIFFVMINCTSASQTEFFSETGHTKAKIKKMPNYSYYDDGSSVNLTCEAEKNTNLYEITWYEHDSHGNPVKRKSELSGTGMLTLTLASLSKEDTGQYTCVISRPQVNYRNAQFVDITVKGGFLTSHQTYCFRLSFFVPVGLNSSKGTTGLLMGYAIIQCQTLFVPKHVRWEGLHGVLFRIYILKCMRR